MKHFNTIVTIQGIKISAIYEPISDPIRLYEYNPGGSPLRDRQLNNDCQNREPGKFQPGSRKNFIALDLR